MISACICLPSNATLRYCLLLLVVTETWSVLHRKRRDVALVFGRVKNNLRARLKLRLRDEFMIRENTRARVRRCAGQETAAAKEPRRAFAQNNDRSNRTNEHDTRIIRSETARSVAMTRSIVAAIPYAPSHHFSPIPPLLFSSDPRHEIRRPLVNPAQRSRGREMSLGISTGKTIQHADMPCYSKWNRGTVEFNPHHSMIPFELATGQRF